MSDINLNFPPWLLVGLALMIALPVTTVVMAGLGTAAYRIRRRDRSRRLAGIKWTALIVAPFWLGGLVFGSVWLISEIHRQLEGAAHYFTLDKAAEVDGIALPAGTLVELDETKALASAELPDGATLALRGATWRGKIVFVEPAHAPNGAHGQIAEGTLAAPANFDGVPCQAGGPAIFFWGGRLMECTLSQDEDAFASVAGPDGVAKVRKFRCSAGDKVDMAGLRPGEIEGCRLAEPADFGEITCAASERILVVNGDLAACTFAKPARFGSLDAPAGTLVTYYDGHPSNFTLPQGAPVDGFGLSLPAGTEGSFCYHSKALERLMLDRSAYVTIEGVKLTGAIDFDCGTFRSGALFEDTVVGDYRRQRGELVSRDDILSHKGG